MDCRAHYCHYSLLFRVFPSLSLSLSSALFSPYLACFSIFLYVVSCYSIFILFFSWKGNPVLNQTHTHTYNTKQPNKNSINGMVIFFVERATTTIIYNIINMYNNAQCRQSCPFYGAHNCTLYYTRSNDAVPKIL